MKKLFMPLILAALLSACAAGAVRSTDVSPAQQYRLAGHDKPTEITGTLQRVYTGFVDETNLELKVWFDNQLSIKGKLDDKYTGEVSGAWLDKKVSALCSSKQVANRWINVSCVVFIDNERTVTLTF